MYDSLLVFLIQALDSALDFLKDGESDGIDESNEFDMFDIYEDSPSFDVNFDLISSLKQQDADLKANQGQSTSSINKQNIDDAIKKWRKHENDCGSAEVQVAIAHEKIKYLTRHLLANKHDVSSRRGLAQMVVNRKKFLNYLYENDKEKALQMVNELGIRFRPKKGAFDRESKYASFKNTKSKWQKLRAQAKQLRDSRAGAAEARAMS